MYTYINKYIYIYVYIGFRATIMAIYSNYYGFQMKFPNSSPVMS